MSICIDCGSASSKVIDTRMSDSGWRIRRRICACGNSFKTYEIPADLVQDSNIDESDLIPRYRRSK